MAQLDEKGWPLLRSAQETDCTEANPMNGQPCSRGSHTGCHRDANGAEWLDRPSTWELHDDPEWQL